MIIESRAYARAGLLGNPSDGYFGKTISIIVKNFGAHISLYESPELIIEVLEQDKNVYKNIYDLVDRIKLHGYYGGDRLIKAGIKAFYDYCSKNNIKLKNKNFSVRYNSSIPRQVGMAGSSAILTATMNALFKFFDVKIKKELLPTLILSAEKEELSINAGLQDRVVQVYEGVVYMDFNKDFMMENNHGKYEYLPIENLPKLYLAYKDTLGKISGVVLNDIASRFKRGEKLVIDTLNEIAELAEEGKKAILNKDHDLLYELMNMNFDLRRKIMNISDENLEMVEIARKCGASARFAGSGGSIIGIYKNDEMLTKLIMELKKINVRVLKPFIS
ncbi:MAG: GHMP kinase [Ignavibacteriales bacterium]|nr:GHMP kinase [Ignavibacteriales bacterium]MCB9211188.1 GHMP kinase [Ignavibacteriales bacterium]MCB9219449.1 GHMP kinase [Ignavibacteriales bacterium]MCB9259877.1 GHMP kinase [Ignavibacteriales bacterium]